MSGNLLIFIEKPMKGENITFFGELKPRAWKLKLFILKTGLITNYRGLKIC